MYTMLEMRCCKSERDNGAATLDPSISVKGCLPTHPLLTPQTPGLHRRKMQCPKSLVSVVEFFKLLNDKPRAVKRFARKLSSDVNVVEYLNELSKAVGKEQPGKLSNLHPCSRN
jgi:hypothetical protein